MKPFILIITLYAATVFMWRVNSQSVGIGTSTPSSSAKLDINSSTQGLLIPRVTTTQRNSISNPSVGLLVFDIDKQTVYIYAGGNWYPMLMSTTASKIPPLPVNGSEEENGDSFGSSVAIVGDYAIIGAPSYVNEDYGYQINQGGAYIFQRINGAWVEQVLLTASNPMDNDYFGTSVAISECGDLAVIGAIAAGGPNDGNQGAVYLFSRTGSVWTQINILTASDGSADDNFGNAVSISGDYIAVGAEKDDVNASNDAGSVYIFYKGSGWENITSHQDKVSAADLMSQDQFGGDVSIWGDYLAVGSYYDDDLGYTDKGSAYIFGRIGSDWIQLAKLGTSDGNDNDYFGYRLSLSDEYLLVCTNINDQIAPVYIYYKDGGWTNYQNHQAIITVPDGTTNEPFLDVALYDDYALLGCSGKEVGANNNQGAAYIYKRSGTSWNFIRRIDDETGMNSGAFGNAVALSGYNVVLGAPGKFNLKGEAQFLNIE